MGRVSAYHQQDNDALFSFFSWFYHQVNLVLPIVVAVTSVYLVVGPIVDDPAVEYLYATGFIILGVAVYAALVYRDARVPGTGKCLRETPLFT